MQKFLSQRSPFRSHIVCLGTDARTDAQKQMCVQTKNVKNIKKNCKN